MLIGYMRVSKSENSQDLDMQRKALIAAGVEASNIYQDSISGKNDDRPGLAMCIKALQPHHVLVVYKLDRLARDLKHLVALVHELSERKIGLKVLAGAGSLIDTTATNGHIIQGIFSALVEFEQELIIERTRVGLGSARARGRQGGRPRKMNATLLKEAMDAMSNPCAIATEVAQKLNVTTATLYTYVNGDGTPKPAGELLLGKKTDAKISLQFLAQETRTNVM